MKKIRFSLGSSIEDAYKLLKDNHPSYGEFNEQKIYSTESLDSMYLKITGKTKTQHYRSVEDAKREMADHKKAIPGLSEKYISEAIGLVFSDKMDLWKKIVPIRLAALYHGMELSCTLEIAKLLKLESFDKADSLFRSQGHSGMSHSLVCQMLKEFIPSGKEFVKRYEK